MLSPTERFALGQYLSEFSDNKNTVFSDVLSSIGDLDTITTIWEPFENSLPEMIVENIENTLFAVEDLIKSLK